MQNRGANHAVKYSNLNELLTWDFPHDQCEGQFNLEETIMRVKPNQNAGIPASAPESETKITDGTSNTIQFGESSKAKKPFANDSFETSAPRGEAKGMQALL
jgi:hypothetical protein